MASPNPNPIPESERERDDRWDHPHVHHYHHVFIIHDQPRHIPIYLFPPLFYGFEKEKNKSENRE